MSEKNDNTSHHCFFNAFFVNVFLCLVSFHIHLLRLKCEVQIKKAVLVCRCLYVCPSVCLQVYNKKITINAIHKIINVLLIIQFCMTKNNK